jgi:hypothetical protein
VDESHIVDVLGARRERVIITAFSVILLALP